MRDDEGARVPPPDFQIRLLYVRVKKGDALVLHALGERQHPVQRDGAKRPEHEQRPVGEIHHPQRAEDERQPQGNQRVGAALVQAVQYLQ